MKAWKEIIFCALCATLILSIPSYTPAQETDGTPRACKPNNSFEYNSGRVAVSFRFSERCLERKSLEAIVAVLKIRRCDLVCSRNKKRFKCVVEEGTCRGSMKVAHPSIEVAEYRTSLSYWSTGRTVMAGFRTRQSHCYSTPGIVGCS